MKLAIFSDLHLEAAINDKFMVGMIQEMDHSSYDIAILAGDISNSAVKVSNFIKEFPKNKHIIYVLGNHENYSFIPMKENFERYQELDSEFVHVLNPGTFEIENIKFIGATLWSSGLLLGYPDKRHLISKYINDFRFFWDNDVFFSVEKMQELNDKEAKFIEEELNNNNKKKVVITHFLPSQQCVAPQYVGDELTPYFCNDLDYLVNNVDMWISGHTHTRMNIIHNGSNHTPVYINPLGYWMEWRKQEIYKPLIVEIKNDS